MLYFEQGNIYPPLESHSMFIRVTRGCSWNKCIFCNSYKNEKFSIRSLEEIENDLLNIRKLQNLNNDIYDYQSTTIYKLANEWKEKESVFLQDTDILLLNTKDILNILKIIKNIFPKVKTFSCYASVCNLEKKPKEELQSLYENGLKRLYIGLESGNKNILELINKKCNYKQIFDSHIKAKDIGFQIYDHYIIGIGGKQYSKENAIDTAKFFNFINPFAVELRTTIVFGNTLLSKLKETKEWIELTEKEQDEELYLFLSNLNFDGYLFSNHECNNYENLNGKFLSNKKKFLNILNI